MTFAYEAIQVFFLFSAAAALHEMLERTFRKNAKMSIGQRKLQIILSIVVETDEKCSGPRNQLQLEST